MEQRVVPLSFTSCAVSPGMTSKARSISCQTTLRKILSTKNCSLFRSFSRRTKPKSELESTTSKYSGPLTKHERVAEGRQGSGNTTKRAVLQGSASKAWEVTCGIQDSHRLQQV